MNHYNCSRYESFVAVFLTVFPYLLGDKEEMVLQGGHVVAVAVDLEGVVDVEGVVVKRYLQKILMLIWRSIIQRQCRQIELISFVFLVGLTPFFCGLLCA